MSINFCFYVPSDDFCIRQGEFLTRTSSIYYLLLVKIMWLQVGEKAVLKNGVHFLEKERCFDMIHLKLEITALCVNSVLTVLRKAQFLRRSRRISNKRIQDPTKAVQNSALSLKGLVSYKARRNYVHLFFELIYFHDHETQLPTV